MTARQFAWFALVLWLIGSGLLAFGAQEGAMGTHPLPPVVGMTSTCPGFVLASGVVTASGDHELRGTPASASIGGYTLMVPSPDLPTWPRVIESRDQAFELVLRPVKPRAMERIER
jgi:hypothetical protein